MSNASKAFLIAPPTPPTPPPDSGGFPTTTTIGTFLQAPGPGTGAIVVPIPAGVNVAYYIQAEVIGSDVVASDGTAQKFWYAANRDAFGNLSVNSAATNKTQAAGGANPRPQTNGASVTSPGTIELGFDNLEANNLRVHYAVSISGPFSAV